MRSSISVNCVRPLVAIARTFFSSTDRPSATMDLCILPNAVGRRDGPMRYARGALGEGVNLKQYGGYLTSDWYRRLR